MGVKYALSIGNTTKDWEALGWHEQEARRIHRMSGEEAG
ncbi:hypothetical protein P3TCK_23478 [Photobacterium profundum 3TCK]|uniref:Uncharacterized protein n=1 Tax=Photobacterium profundum 3TCK TaxID=314280 RepID=Q1YX14_9GAMM|nr:hypothetical protein P3TCK_23478 [Photobacterium profundum 3TCK]